MYDFHYSFIKKRVDVELLFTDTDCLTHEIKSFLQQLHTTEYLHVFLSTNVQVLCSSFGRALPKLKRMQYKDTKEKNQMIFSHVLSFCHTGS